MSTLYNSPTFVVPDFKKFSSNLDLPQFSTTLGINADNFSQSHPSLFQNPSVDEKYDKDSSMAHTALADSMWGKLQENTAVPTFTSTIANTSDNDRLNNMPNHFVVRDPSDLPLSKSERDFLYQKFAPMLDRNFSNTQRTILYCAFFSKDNIANIQQNLKWTVNRCSGHTIGKQSEIELLQIMESVYTSYARNLDERNAPSKVLFRWIRMEIGRLDNIVVETAMPQIVDAIEQHVAFLSQSEKGRTSSALPRPVDTSITGTMQYRAPSAVSTMTTSLS